MVDQMKNLLIGLFVVAAIAVVIFTFTFLHPYIGDEGTTLRVRFTDIDKISVGTRVALAGKPIGEVVKIQEVKEALKKRVGRNGNIYSYELVLKIDSSINVFNTDEISLRTSGLLGERSILITPHPPLPDQKLRIVNDEIIYAEEAASVEETFKDLSGVADKFDLALDAITEAFNTLRDEKLWENLGAIAENMKDITTSLNEPNQWSELLANIHDVSHRAKNSWNTVDESLDHIASTFANTSDVMEKVSQGEGSFGKMLVKDDLYLKTSSILSKAETTMDDVNHYGLLFHLDKGWQRLRARRMNLLQKLKTPQEFRNFFNDEVDQISTALSRVSMVLEKSKFCSPQYPGIMNCPEYIKVYGELLRRVEGLEEALQMYNQQIVDTEVKKTELAIQK